MHHLHRAGKRQRLVPVPAAQAAEFQRQYRPDSLSSGQKAVAHGVKQALLRQILRKARGKLRFHRRAVDVHPFTELCHRVHTPFLPANRRRIS